MSFVIGPPAVRSRAVPGGRRCDTADGGATIPGNDPTRRAAAGVVVFSAVIPVLEVVFIGQLPGVRAMLVVAALTACVLPGFLRLVLHTVRGTRMRYAGWVLAAATAAGR